MKLTRCPAKEKNEARKAKKEEGRGEKGKSKTQDGCVTFKPKFCFLCMPKLRKLIFCIWIGRTQSAQPANGLVVGFC